MTEACEVCPRQVVRPEWQAGSRLCIVHATSRELGVLEADYDGALQGSLLVLESRLRERASKQDADRLLDLLNAAPNKSAGLIQSARLSLIPLSNEVFLGGRDARRVARAEAAAVRAVYQAGVPDGMLFRLESLRARIRHLRGDYDLAVALHEGQLLGGVSDSVLTEGIDLSIEKSLLSASLYLSGRHEESRRLARELFEENQESELAGRQALVVAKEIEHHLASNEVEIAAEVSSHALERASTKPPKDIQEAVYRVILMRDSGLSLMVSSDSTRGRAALTEARNISLEFGLLDQLDKIDSALQSAGSQSVCEKEGSVEEVVTKTDRIEYG